MGIEMDAVDHARAVLGDALSLSVDDSGTISAEWCAGRFRVSSGGHRSASEIVQLLAAELRQLAGRIDDAADRLSGCESDPTASIVRVLKTANESRSGLARLLKDARAVRSALEFLTADGLFATAVEESAAVAANLQAAATAAKDLRRRCDGMHGDQHDAAVMALRSF